MTNFVLYCSHRIFNYKSRKNMFIKNILNNLNITDISNISKHLTTEKNTQQKSFFDYMSDTLKNISIQQNNTENKITNFQSNESNNNLNDIMIDLQKSSIDLALLIQIRNKFVSSYQEIMNMQI